MHAMFTSLHGGGLIWHYYLQGERNSVLDNDAKKKQIREYY